MHLLWDVLIMQSCAGTVPVESGAESPDIDYSMQGMRSGSTLHILVHTFQLSTSFIVGVLSRLPSRSKFARH